MGLSVRTQKIVPASFLPPILATNVLAGPVIASFFGHGDVQAQATYRAILHCQTSGVVAAI